MKITNKKNIDPIAEARKNKHFEKYSDEANVKIKFASAVYNARTKKRMSQQELAKKAQTTQKRISNIENADVDLGMNSIYRISQALCFDSKTLADIFGCDFNPYVMIFSETANSQISQISELLPNKIY